jgi:DNA-binding NarL/FixJ family response regulator
MSPVNELVPIRVAIVDDNAGVRSSLSGAVARFPGCECISQYASAEAALAGIPKDEPDVVLMDINMPGLNGIECVRRLKATHPHIEFIMLTVYEDTDSIFDALSAGASGYLLKLAAREELYQAIQQVRAGGSPMTSHIARKVVQAFRQSAQPPVESAAVLTKREQQVLELLAKGFIYKEIAESLKISYETVHNHIRRIYEKLQVRSRAQAVAKYFKVVHPTASKSGAATRRPRTAPGSGE